jgi:hypothetical protein
MRRLFLLRNIEGATDAGRVVGRGEPMAAFVRLNCGHPYMMDSPGRNQLLGHAAGQYTWWGGRDTAVLVG